jgi:CRISPR/Cas system CSM-associated protein Csm3 (group 7 of RAMP superfamily)
MSQNSKITYDIVLRAKLTNCSPLVMGAQQSEEIDLEILQHSDGRPYISGTAFAGKLLRAFEDDQLREELEDFDKNCFEKNKNYLLGNGEDSQSHILIENLELVGDRTYEIVLNDSNKISKETGSVDNKFNFQKLEPGCSFELKVHFKLRAGFDLTFFKDAVCFMRSVLNSDFHLGAKTTKGYGKMELKDFSVCVFDYQQENAFASWEHYLRTGSFEDEFSTFAPKYFRYKPLNKLRFVLNLAIQSQFITGEMLTDNDELDKAQSQRKGEFLLKGEAAKNALSHRAFRILNTINPTDKPWIYDLMKYLFGEDLTDEEDHIPSRLRVNESLFKNVSTEKQTRIKISRFTGGTVKGALATAVPIHSTTAENIPNITLKFELTEDEAHKDSFSNSVTLLLMLIKDLFNGDLPIGGEKAIGKGVMRGCESQIHWNEETVTIDHSGIQGNTETFLHEFNQFKLPKYA